ncbi:MAG: hypothetical protein ABEI39_04065 [Halobacteriales archaeon]
MPAPRSLPALGLLAGLLHLLAPEVLLSTAAWAYDRVLAVEFDPREGATRRVRLVGLAFLVGSLLFHRLPGTE